MDTSRLHGQYDRLVNVKTYSCSINQRLRSNRKDRISNPWSELGNHLDSADNSFAEPVAAYMVGEPFLESAVEPFQVAAGACPIAAAAYRTVDADMAAAEPVETFDAGMAAVDMADLGKVEPDRAAGFGKSVAGDIGAAVDTVVARRMDLVGSHFASFADMAMVLDLYSWLLMMK